MSTPVQVAGGMGSLTRQWIATLTASLCVAMTGVSFAWMAPLMMKLVAADSPLPMTTSDSSWLSSFIEFGQLIGTIPAGILSDRYGRKPVILSAGPMCLVSFLLVATTRSLVVLYVVRVLQGLATAIAFTIVPMYIAEVAHPHVRGVLSGQFKVMWYVGTLYCYSIGPFVDYNSYAYICGLIPIVFMLTYFFVPESPYYLLMVKNERAAKQALKWLRNDEAGYTNELQSIKSSVDDDMSKKGHWTDLFATKKDRLVFLIVQIVCLLKMLNGMPAILMYASQIFSEQFKESISSDSMTIIFGAVLLITSCFASVVADRVGRRPLLIFSCAGSALTNLITAIMYYLDQCTDIDVSSYRWISYFSVLAFCIVTNIGLGPLMTTIQAEYFPSNTRGIGGGFTEVVAAIGAFTNIKQYQFVNDHFGIYTNFFIFFLVSFIGTFLLAKVIPETAGKSLGQIQKSFEHKELTEKKNGNSNI